MIPREEQASVADIVRQMTNEPQTPMSFCVRELLKASMVASGEEVPMVQQLKAGENLIRHSLMKAAARACLLGEEGSRDYSVSFRHLNSRLLKDCEALGVSNTISPKEIKEIVAQAVKAGYIIRKRTVTGVRYLLGDVPVPDSLTTTGVKNVTE